MEERASEGRPRAAPPLEVWIEEPVRLVLPSGRTRYLVRVVRARCERCGTGMRTVSVWVGERGDAEHVAWCGHCFNATCELATADEAIRERYRRLKLAAARGAAPRPWRAVRPALEDLERRGLL